MNLSLNARDAMPTGGSLRLRTVNAPGPVADGAPPGRYVVLEVTDTGGGMTPDQCRQAFEPFFTTKAKGTGLGLPTVARIVRTHGGHMVLKSEVDSGTTFAIYLPQTDETSGPPRIAGSAGKAERLAGPLEFHGRDRYNRPRAARGTHRDGAGGRMRSDFIGLGNMGWADGLEPDEGRT